MICSCWRAPLQTRKRPGIVSKAVHRLRLEVKSGEEPAYHRQEGFAFLALSFARNRGGPLCMWPRKKAWPTQQQRCVKSCGQFQAIKPLEAGYPQKLKIQFWNGWCTYFRVGNSNRVFHEIDWAVRSEVQLWLRRKYRCDWANGKRRWNYRAP